MQFPTLHQRMRARTDHRKPIPHRDGLEKHMRTTIIPTIMPKVVEREMAVRHLEADGVMPAAVNSNGKKPMTIMKMQLTAAMMATPITATHVQTLGWIRTTITSYALFGENPGQREQQEL